MEPRRNIIIWKDAYARAMSDMYNDALPKPPPPTALYVLGNAQVGKTSLIDELLGRDGKPDRDGLGLTYAHGVRLNQDKLVTQEVDVLEFAGSANEGLDTITVPFFTLKNLELLTVVLVLDLEELDTMWMAFEKIVPLITREFKKYVYELDYSVEEEMLGKLKERIERKGVTKFEVEPSKEDLKLREYFPFPLVIVGGKYDRFMRKHEPEKQKTVCRFLRLLALKYQATLVYYNSFDIISNGRIRSILSHYAYGTPFPQTIKPKTDYLEPILIPPHCDTWEKIKFPLPIKECTMSKLSGYAYEKFGIEEVLEDKELIFNPVTDTKFREVDIDIRYQEEKEKLEDEEFERRYKKSKEKEFYDYHHNLF